MRFAAIFLIALAIPSQAHGGLVYSIGNSLTVDAYPWYVQSFGGWHIRSGAKLSYIHANPHDATYSNPAGTWDVALANQQFDFVTVQPFGDTVAQSVAAISDWMTMQPTAQFVVHVYWPRLSLFNEAAVDDIIASTEQVIAELGVLHPGRTVTRDYSVDALLQMQRDIDNGVSPFLSLGEIYRDDIHLTTDTGAHAFDNGEGRYLMHQLLRKSLGQAPRANYMLDIPTDKRAYLDNLIATIPVAVPEASQFAMAGAVGLLVVAARFMCRK